MAQLITWLVVLAVIGLAFFALVRENDRKRRRTADEWERDFAAGQGTTTQLIKAGALGLEGILIEEKRDAIEYRQDEQQGMTRTGNKGDDRDRTAAGDDGKE